MRFRSTPESVGQLQPSLLAVVETLLSCTLWIIIAVRFHTIQHIVFGASVAPLLLLRTPHSEVLGWRIWSRMALQTLPKVAAVARIVDDGGGGFLRRSSLTVVFLLGVLLIGLQALLAKVLGTLLSLLCHLPSSLRAIYPNWRRAVLVQDVYASPESIAIPPPDTLSVELQNIQGDPKLSARLPAIASAYRVIAGVTEDLDAKPTWKNVTNLASLLAALVGFVIPAFCYRVSLKATAILWFPALWATGALSPRALPIEQATRLFLTSDMQRIARFVSVVGIMVVTSKLTLHLAQSTLPNLIAAAARPESDGVIYRWIRRCMHSTQEASPLDTLIWDLASIHELPMWHVATLLGSILCIGQWLWVRSVSRRAETQIAIQETSFDIGFAITQFMRRLLAVYSWSCTLYIAARLAFKLPWPPLGTRVFPWG